MYYSLKLFNNSINNYNYFKNVSFLLISHELSLVLSNTTTTLPLDAIFSSSKRLNHRVVLKKTLEILIQKNYNTVL